MGQALAEIFSIEFNVRLNLVTQVGLSRTDLICLDGAAAPGILTEPFVDANHYFHHEMWVYAEQNEWMILWRNMDGNDKTDSGSLMTQGVHHLGLTVSCLEASAGFFTGALGWQEVRRVPEYPAIFVSDGTMMVTLWQAGEAGSVQPFDHRQNVGLHHVAFRVASRAALHAVFERVQASGARIEFAPERLRDGPLMHMMCYEPSGIRVEFIWVPEPE